MYQTPQEFIEDEFYTQLSVTCIKCQTTYSPYEQPEWVGTGNLELDAHKMKDEYAPKLIELGWSTNSEGDVLCPSCK